MNATETIRTRIDRALRKARPTSAFEEALKEEIRLELYREFGPDGVECTPNVAPDETTIKDTGTLFTLLARD